MRVMSNRSTKQRVRVDERDIMSESNEINDSNSNESNDSSDVVSGTILVVFCDGNENSSESSTSVVTLHSNILYWCCCYYNESRGIFKSRFCY